jgi:RNA polymerase sigma-70 factor (sigma-E family)
MAQRAALVRVAALLVSGDLAKAEDVVQTALTRLYVAWPKVRKSTAGAYARRCVVNAAMDERRSLFSRRERVSAQLPDLAAADPQRGDATALVALLGSLPAGMRAAVVLRYVEGLSAAEAAEAMGCSEGNVRSQSARGLDRLREALPQPARRRQAPDPHGRPQHERAQPPQAQYPQPSMRATPSDRQPCEGVTRNA